MANVFCVIGSLFGDEGKGYVTDFLLSKNIKNAVNVRFNGGAQASHTVTDVSGMRHAFRHFGSGSFLGVPTYLTEDFLVDPVPFMFELVDLQKSYSIIPEVYVHYNARVATYYDVLINRMMESLRGEAKHGSCGFGINEIVQRNKIPEYAITVKDIANKSKVREKLIKIRDEYVPKRLKEYHHVEMDDIPESFRKEFFSENVIEIQLYYFDEFLKNVDITDDDILLKFDNIVFEGAQGLLLDEFCLRYAPHLTTSNTGIKNIMATLSHIDFHGKIEIFYVSRCYMTRHGRGMLPRETKGKPYEKIVDLTNVPNEYQETLRFGILDLDVLLEAIMEDLENLQFDANINLFMTCLNQLDDISYYYYKGKLCKASKENFAQKIKNIVLASNLKISKVYTSYGQTRLEVEEP